MLVTVRTIPPEVQPDQEAGNLVAALSAIPGELLEGFEDGGLTFTVPAITLAAA